MGFVREVIGKIPINRILIPEVRMRTTYEHVEIIFRDHVIWEWSYVNSGMQWYYHQIYSGVQAFLQSYYSCEIGLLRDCVDDYDLYREVVDWFMIKRYGSGGRTFSHKSYMINNGKGLDYLSDIMLASDRRISSGRYLPMLLTNQHEEVRNIVAHRMK